MGFSAPQSCYEKIYIALDSKNTKERSIMGKRRSMMYKAILAIVALLGIVLLVNGAQDNALAYVTFRRS